jgi:hypothetical protein
MALRAWIPRSGRCNIASVRPFRIAASSLVLLLAGCSAAITNLPTHHVQGGGPTGIQDGTLQQSGPCVYVVSPSGAIRWLVIWPGGFRLSNGQILDDRESPVAAVGRSVTLGGGEYHDNQYAFLRTLMNGDVLAECRNQEYWLAISVIASQ